MRSAIVAGFLITAAVSGVLASRVVPRRLGSPVPVAARTRAAPAATSALFRCGPLRCDARVSYCETIGTDVPALPSNHACRPLAAACKPEAGSPARDCGCFPRTTRGDFCGAPLRDGLPNFYRTTVGGR